MFITAVLLAALSAPVSKAKPVFYFPITVGTKRVLETTTDGKSRLTTEEVTKVEEKDGVYQVTMGWTAFGNPTTQVYEVTPGKVLKASVRDPRTLFDTGVKAGGSWSVEHGTRGRAVVTTYTVGKEEEVEVPAGKYKAIPITEQLERSEVKTTRWYAPDVGLVKETEVYPSYTTTTVLKSFTSGEQEKK